MRKRPAQRVGKAAFAAETCIVVADTGRGTLRPAELLRGFTDAALGALKPPVEPSMEPQKRQLGAAEDRWRASLLVASLKEINHCLHVGAR